MPTRIAKALKGNRYACVIAAAMSALHKLRRAAGAPVLSPSLLPHLGARNRAYLGIAREVGGREGGRADRVWDKDKNGRRGFVVNGLVFATRTPAAVGAEQVYIYDQRGLYIYTYVCMYIYDQRGLYIYT